MIKAISAGASLACASTSSIPARTPSSGAREVVSTLTLKRFGPSSRARSVKVPPISTARRALAISLCRRRLNVATEIGLPDTRVGPHLGRRPLHELAPLLHHQGAVGNQQSPAHILLHDQHRNSGRGDLPHGGEDVALHLRRQA